MTELNESMRQYLRELGRKGGIAARGKHPVWDTERARAAGLKSAAVKKARREAEQARDRVRRYDGT